MQSSSCIFDHQIRETLKKNLRERDGAAAIIEELPLMRGRGRADLAFVNGELCGYEIKSEADSLVRLGIQAPYYESVFEFITLVAAPKHLKLAESRIPQTWGIVEARHIAGQVDLIHRRSAQRNNGLNSAALARLLWKNECLFILKRTGLPAHPQTPVVELWSLIEGLDIRQLCDEVREALKRRRSKVGPQRIQCGG